jgi:hypothetical protein
MNSDQQSPTRDYAGNPTGFTDNGLPLAKINAETGMFMWDGKTNNALSFFLDRVDMTWQEARPQNKLPARWEVELIVTIGDSPETAKQYRIPISSHWNNSIMSSVMNAIRGGLDSPKWKSEPGNRWARIVLHLKDSKAGGTKTCGAWVFKSNATADWLDPQFPWEKDQKAPTGVPESLDDQKPFWLAIAKQCADLTGGSVRGADKATIKFEGLHAVNPAAQATQPAVQAPAVSKYEEALLTKLNIILSDPIDDSAEKSLKMKLLYDDLLVKVPPGNHGHSDEWLKGKIILFATQNSIADPFGGDLPF